MKVLSIGRNPDCNIVCNDNMVSRRHALLKIYPNGKYEIISQGPNGTTVNGNLIVPNQPYPVKRGDMVIFASHSKLDWRKVPDPLKPYKIGAIAFGAVAIVIAAILLVDFFASDSDDVYEGGGAPVELVPVDTTAKDNIVSPDEPANEDKEDLAPSDSKEDAKPSAVLPGKEKTDVESSESESSAVDPIQAEIMRKEKVRAERKKAQENRKKGKTEAPATTKPAKKDTKTPEPSKAPEPVPEPEPVKETAPAEPEPEAPATNPRL